MKNGFDLIANQENRITADAQLTAVSNLLQTSAGRNTIAAELGKPLRDYRDYTGVGRRAFQVDELGQGEIAVYDKDVDTPAFVVAEEGSDVQVIARGERVFVPLFEIASNIMIPLTKIRERRYDLHQRVKEKVRHEIVRVEDRAIFKQLTTIAESTEAINDVITVKKSELSIETFSEAKALIERHGDVYAANIFINPTAQVALRRMNKDHFIDFETTRKLLDVGYLGRLYNMDIHTSPEIPEDTILITAEPEFFGRMVIGQDITVLNADEPTKRQFGFSIFEQIGLFVHNAKGVAMIKIVPDDDNSNPTPQP